MFHTFFSPPHPAQRDKLWFAPRTGAGGGGGELVFVVCVGPDLGLISQI